MPLPGGNAVISQILRQGKQPKGIHLSPSSFIRSPAAPAAVGPANHAGLFVPGNSSPEAAPFRLPGQPAPTIITRPRQKQTNFYRGLSSIVSPIKGMDPRDFTSSYGPRINPVTHRPSFHTGIDIGAGMGTPVRAVANGKIEQTNVDDVYGNQVIMAHGRNKETMYGHMDKFIVKPGERVRAGQVIGFVGSTGWSTGPHLHWETWIQGNQVNPLTFLGG